MFPRHIFYSEGDKLLEISDSLGSLPGRGALQYEMDIYRCKAETSEPRGIR